MKRSIIDFPGASYTFNPSLKMVTILGLPFSLEPNKVRSIINASKNTLIYRIDKKELGSTSITSNIINLTYNTSSMSAADDLSIRFNNV